MGGVEVSSELQSLVDQAVKDIKKGKGAEKRQMRLNCDELALQLDDASVRKRRSLPARLPRSIRGAGVCYLEPMLCLSALGSVTRPTSKYISYLWLPST